MMKERSAGKWRIALSPPYPIWITISFDGESVFNGKHEDLRDLEYIIARAREDAKHMLGEKDAHEA